MTRGSCVIALIPFSLQLASGQAVNERQFLETLARRVDKVIVFSLRFLGRKKQKIVLPENVTLIELPAVPYFGTPLSLLFSLILSLVILMISTFSDNKVKLIYARSTWFAFGLLWNKKTRSKTLIKFSGLIEDTMRLGGIFGVIFKRLAYVVDKVVLLRGNKIAIPSIAWRKILYYRRKVFLFPSKFLIVPAGVNMEKICRFEVDKYKPSHRGDTNTFRIVFLGLLAWWQGIDILIKAFDMIHRRFPGTNLIIVGDGPLRKSIERYAKKRKLDIKITGYVSHDKALEILSKADALVLPSLRTENTEATIPIKVLEAWALGIPVIVTEHKVFKYYGVKNYEHVIFCEPNPKSVSKAICVLLSNRFLRERLSMNAFELVKRFDYDNLVGKVLSSCCS